MKIVKLSPQGFCGGVKKALQIADETLENNNNVYLLGALIHNNKMMQALKNKGAYILEGTSRLKMLDEIENGTIIISAHGARKEVYEKALKKGLKIVDATCPNVKKIHFRIEKYLNMQYNILYIGKKYHPETEGILGISDNIKLITNIDDLKDIKIADKTYVTNQTTLSLYDIKDITDKLFAINNKIIFDNQICMATTLRQKAIINQQPADLCIIVGDKTSSNSNALYQLSSLKCPSIMVENLEDIINYDFKKIKTINITSGASTPSFLVDEIIKYLRTIKN